MRWGKQVRKMCRSPSVHSQLKTTVCVDDSTGKLEIEIERERVIIHLVRVNVALLCLYYLGRWRKRFPSTTHRGISSIRLPDSINPKMSPLVVRSIWLWSASTTLNIRNQQKIQKRNASLKHETDGFKDCFFGDTAYNHIFWHANLSSNQPHTNCP